MYKHIMYKHTIIFMYIYSWETLLQLLHQMQKMLIINRLKWNSVTVNFSVFHLNENYFKINLKVKTKLFYICLIQKRIFIYFKTYKT